MFDILKQLTMKDMKSMKSEFSELSQKVLGCAIEVLRMLGAVEELKGIHEAQLLTYLKLSGIK